MSEKEDAEFDSSAESDTSSVFASKEEDIRRKIDDVLRAFDQRDEEAIDVGDLGNVFRCMRVNISQAEMYEIESQLLKENNTVSFEHLIPRLLSAVQERKFRPLDEATMELAFQSLEASDVQLSRDRLEILMCTRGEPLSDVEFKDMLSHVAIRRSGVVDWKSYVRDITEAVTNDKI